MLCSSISYKIRKMRGVLVFRKEAGTQKLSHWIWLLSKMDTTRAPRSVIAGPLPLEFMGAEWLLPSSLALKRVRELVL